MLPFGERDFDEDMDDEVKCGDMDPWCSLALSDDMSTLPDIDRG
jgi:hypothetical protein